MAGWRSHEEIIAWQLAYELKIQVYALIEGERRVQRDLKFTQSQVVPLQRLCKRASKASTRLIGYLKTAEAPGEERRHRNRQPREPSEPGEPREPREPSEPRERKEPKPSAPEEPPEPMEPMD